jgi:hypothetical protein
MSQMEKGSIDIDVDDEVKHKVIITKKKEDLVSTIIKLTRKNIKKVKRDDDGAE